MRGVPWPPLPHASSGETRQNANCNCESAPGHITDHGVRIIHHRRVGLARLLWLVSGRHEVEFI